MKQRQSYFSTRMFFICSGMDESPPNTTSIFEAARLGWNLKVTCWRCGHVRVLHAAAVWLRLSVRGRPDHVTEVKRYGKCMTCLKERREIITGPKVELVRDKADAEWLPMPNDRQLKDGMKRMRQ